MTGWKNIFSRSQPINMRFWPSVRSRWLNIGQVLICDFIKRKKERGEYSAILNEQALSIKYLLYGQKVSLYLRDQRGKTRAPRSGSQWKCRIRFILPTLGFRKYNKNRYLLPIISSPFMPAARYVIWFEIWLVRLNFRNRGSNANVKEKEV